MPTYTVDNEQEFDRVKEIVDDAERIARRLYAWKNPGDYITNLSFHSSYLPEKKAAWEMACGMIDELTGEDPERALDALNDALNGQIDPCDLDKAARLEAA